MNNVVCKLPYSWEFAISLCFYIAFQQICFMGKLACGFEWPLAVYCIGVEDMKVFFTKRIWAHCLNFFEFSFEKKCWEWWSIKKTRYFDTQEEVNEACPVCRGTCMCKDCFKNLSKDTESKVWNQFGLVCDLEHTLPDDNRPCLSFFVSLFSGFFGGET